MVTSSAYLAANCFAPRLILALLTFTSPRSWSSSVFASNEAFASASICRSVNPVSFNSSTPLAYARV